MANKIKFIVILFTIFFYNSCSKEKFSSSIEEKSLICGSKNIDNKTNVIKIFDSKGNPVKGQEVNQVTFNGEKLELTNEGCALIPKKEGELFVKVFSQNKKEMIKVKIKRFDDGIIQKVSLKKLFSLKEKKISQRILQEICGTKNLNEGVYYTKENRHKFILSFKEFESLEGIDLNLSYKYKKNPSKSYIKYNGPLLKILDETVNFSLDEKNPLILKIELKDSFDNEFSIKKKVCSIVRNINKPVLARINGFKVIGNEVPIFEEPMVFNFKIKGGIHLEKIEFISDGGIIKEFKDSLQQYLKDGSYGIPTDEIEFIKLGKTPVNITLRLIDRIGNLSEYKLKIKKRESYNLPHKLSNKVTFTKSKGTFLNGKNLFTYKISRLEDNLQSIKTSKINLKEDQHAFKYRFLSEKKISIILGSKKGIIESFSIYNYNESSNSWIEEKGHDLKPYNLEIKKSEKDWASRSVAISPKGTHLSYIDLSAQKIKIFKFTNPIEVKEIKLRFHGGIFQQFFDKKGESIIFSDRHGSVGSLKLKDFPETRGVYLNLSDKPLIYGPLKNGYYVIPGRKNIYRMDPTNPEETSNSNLDLCKGLMSNYCKDEENFHILGHNEKMLGLGLGKRPNEKDGGSKKLILLDYLSWRNSKKIIFFFNNELKHVAISPDNKKLMVSFKKNNLVSLVDIASRKIIKTYTHEDHVVALKWIKNNRSLSLSRDGNAIFTKIKLKGHLTDLKDIDHFKMFEDNLIFYTVGNKKYIHDFKRNKKNILPFPKDENGKNLFLYEKHNFYFLKGKSSIQNNAFPILGASRGADIDGFKLIIITPEFKLKEIEENITVIYAKKEDGKILFLIPKNNNTKLLLFDIKNKSFSDIKSLKLNDIATINYTPEIGINDSIKRDFVHLNNSKDTAIISFTKIKKSCRPSVSSHIPGEICMDENWNVFTIYDLKENRVIEEKDFKSSINQTIPPFKNGDDLLLNGKIKIKLKNGNKEFGIIKTMDWENIISSENQRALIPLEKEIPSNLMKENDFPNFKVIPKSLDEIKIVNKEKNSEANLSFYNQELITKKNHPNGQFLFFKTEMDDGVYLKFLDLDNLKIVERFLLKEEDSDYSDLYHAFADKGNFLIKYFYREDQKDLRIFPLHFFNKNTFDDFINLKSPMTPDVD